MPNFTLFISISDTAASKLACFPSFKCSQLVLLLFIMSMFNLNHIAFFFLTWLYLNLIECKLSQLSPQNLEDLSDKKDKNKWCSESLHEQRPQTIRAESAAAAQLIIKRLCAIFCGQRVFLSQPFYLFPYLTVFSLWHHTVCPLKKNKLIYIHIIIPSRKISLMESVYQFKNSRLSSQVTKLKQLVARCRPRPRF